MKNNVTASPLLFAVRLTNDSDNFYDVKQNFSRGTAVGRNEEGGGEQSLEITQITHSALPQATRHAEEKGKHAQIKGTLCSTGNYVEQCVCVCDIYKRFTLWCRFVIKKSNQFRFRGQNGI